MKRLLMIGLVLMLTACVASAQSFPVTKTAFWTPNQAADGVTSYKVWVDSGAKATVLLSTCSATECTAQISIASAGTHILSCSAVNTAGEGVPSTNSFVAAVTAVVVGLGIR